LRKVGVGGRPRQADEDHQRKPRSHRAAESARGYDIGTSLKIGACKGRPC
jgi:hypothetical protein